MEGKLIKLELSEYYRLDDLNGNYIASTLKGKNKLSLKNCEAIKNGYDLDELVSKWVFEKNGHKWSNNDNSAGDNYGSFIAGAKAILEILGDKKFSEDDIKKAFNVGWIQRHNEKGSHYEIMEKVIQSLQQTEWDVEIEMFKSGDLESVEEDWVKLNKPKLDENGCLILKRK